MENAVINGFVNDLAGASQPLVSVRIPALNLGTTTAMDGTYELVVPASLIITPTMQVVMEAARLGLKSASAKVTIGAGSTVIQEFNLAEDTANA